MSVKLINTVAKTFIAIGALAVYQYWPERKVNFKKIIKLNRDIKEWNEAVIHIKIANCIVDIDSIAIQILEKHMQKSIYAARGHLLPIPRVKSLNLTVSHKLPQNTDELVKDLIGSIVARIKIPTFNDIIPMLDNIVIPFATEPKYRPKRALTCRRLVKRSRL